MKIYIKWQSEAIYVYLLAFIVISLPYSHLLSSLGIAALAACWLVSGNWPEKWVRLKRNMPALCLLTLFAVFLVSLIYTDHFLRGWWEIEKKLALLVFPLILGSLQLSDTRRIFILKAYVFSAVCSALYGVGLVYAHYLNHTAQGMQMNFAYYQWILPYLHDFLVPRWTMFAGGAALVSFWFFLRTKKWLYALLFLFLNAFIIFLASRMALVAVWGVFLAYFMVKAVQEKKLYLLVGPLLFLVISSGVLWYASPYIRSKVNNASGTSDRTYLWRAGYEAWLQSPLLGHGAGTGTVAVEEVFLARGYPVTLKSFEVHNQYLSFLLHYGLLGLGLFVAAFLTAFYGGWKKGNVLILLLLPFFYCTFFTETLLANHQGVITFALLFSLLAGSPIQHVSKY
ncbi:O-antigen ligase family protein [Cesiribacter andamanensis]|nr:O-antigen ligase family protein [Cesiribacter andamanensis]